MSEEAKELRELARDIYALAGARRIASIAWPAVNALIEYLTLKARVIELEGWEQHYVELDSRGDLRAQARAATTVEAAAEGVITPVSKRGPARRD